ncbi:hypothetical protein L596_012703 [Steinernema carpocapsae]|uniref:Uncharacterized protein n=1 Tax=Steinernema carpocapsae TaxID=34508 RepID=A0A4U5NY65_STECR|nr:hypothetical protein L596_012703 [Steinernema carpocapsae]
MRDPPAGREFKRRPALIGNATLLCGAARLDRLDDRVLLWPPDPLPDVLSSHAICGNMMRIKEAIQRKKLIQQLNDEFKDDDMESHLDRLVEKRKGESWNYQHNSNLKRYLNLWTLN